MNTPKWKIEVAIPNSNQSKVYYKGELLDCVRGFNMSVNANAVRPIINLELVGIDAEIVTVSTKADEPDDEK